MNIEELRRQLNESIERLTTLRGQETRSADESAEVVTLTATAKRLQGEIRSLQDADSILQQVAEARATSAGRIGGNEAVAAAVEAASEERSETRAVTPGELLTSSEGYRQWAETRSARPFEFDLETRALQTSARIVSEMSSYLRPQVLPGIRRNTDLYGSLRDVLAVGSTNAESIIFFREDTFTNAAAFVGEAEATGGQTGVKPESDISFEEDDAKVGTIAHWIALTSFLEWNAPELRSYIDGRLIDGLNLKEDAALLTANGVGQDPVGLLNTTGIQELDNAYFTGSPTLNAGTLAEPLDRIARAKRLIQDVARSRANFVVMNPEDEEYFQTIMDSNGHYYAGGPFSPGLAPNFWGLRKVVNEHMPQGQVLVGDGSEAQIWDRMSARISVGVVNDQFIRNMKTVLAEKRVGLAVYKPAAFAVVDLFA